MRIRSARTDNLKDCLELDASYETETAWQMEEVCGPGEWGMRFREVRLPRTQRITPSPSPEARLEAWQRRDGFWIAVERGKTLGYVAVVLEVEHRQARVTDLVVVPARRREGIGSELLTHATRWCLRQSVDQLILECRLKAQPCIAFAQKHGFAVCGFQDAYWPEQETGLFLRKRIR